MTTEPKYKSDVFKAIHASAHALFEVGAIDSTALRNFDQSCLTAPLKSNPLQTKESSDEKTTR
jgi:putative transcriptional regulator